MKALVLHTGAPIVHWEDNTHTIYVVEAKIVITRVKHIGIHVYFLHEQFDNGLFIQKYDKSSFMPEDMCTKPCSGPIISWGNKWTTGFRFYRTSDTKHYQLVILHGFFLN